ncbi:uncharacterized protein yc1106_08270 [Curvularia clavata]|uniref:Uncharacterized protein n=1 Tax=Curvularia clavata TaxID=95742 RepID=A0A9Q8ZD08_CURCL|nr:uncharacterized protein yc1106_08270 [Curvularia clavata]
MSSSAKSTSGEKAPEKLSHLDLSLDKGLATSPPFKGSGATFHGNKGWNTHASRDDAGTCSSPVGPESLDFSSLIITNEDDLPQIGSVERYIHPFQRGPTQLGEGQSYAAPGRNFVSHQRQESSYSDKRGSGISRAPTTWLSRDAQINQDFLLIRNSMRRLFKNSEVAKWKLSDYVAHREAMNKSRTKILARQARQQGAPSYSVFISEAAEAFLRRCGLNGNFKEVGNFGRVLGEPTIWCRDWQNGKDEVTPWPSVAEMRWEGDDRAKTGVGRFLPLPREEGPPGLTWSQLPVVEQYPMDEVCKIPTMEDVYLPVDYYIEPEYEYLWSKELEYDMEDLLAS